MQNIRPVPLVVAKKSVLLRTKERPTDERTDGRTDNSKAVYPPLLRRGGILKGIWSIYRHDTESHNKRTPFSLILFTL